MDALQKGDVPVVAGDALVGAYIARDYPNVHLAGQMESATLLGVAVAPENAEARGRGARSARRSVCRWRARRDSEQMGRRPLPKLTVEASEEASETTGAATP